MQNASAMKGNNTMPRTVSEIEADIAAQETVSEEGKRLIKNLRKQLSRARLREENGTSGAGASLTKDESEDSKIEAAVRANAEDERIEQETRAHAYVGDLVLADKQTAANAATANFNRFIVKGEQPFHYGKDVSIKEAIQRLRDTGWKFANGARFAYWGTEDIRVENGEIAATAFVCVGEV
jgi:hypothetical protein